MSIFNLLKPNDLNLFAENISSDKINGIQGTIITPSNTIGQALKIKSVEPKEVEFQDVNEIPDATGFPDGYVLKIIDNTTNTVNWAVDAGPGSSVPFILTGDSPTAFQVRNNSLQPSLIVDTDNSTVQLTGVVRVEGNVDDEKKFGVYNSSDTFNPEFAVDTLNHKTKVGGIGVKEKFAVATASGNNEFAVNTELGIGSCRIKGANSVGKFAVENAGVTKILNVDTVTDVLSSNGKVLVAGSNDTNKFRVENIAGDEQLSVDTTLNLVKIGPTNKLQVHDIDQCKFSIISDAFKPTIELNAPVTDAKLTMKASNNFISTVNEIDSNKELSIQALSNDLEVSAGLQCRVNGQSLVLSGSNSAELTCLGGDTLVQSFLGDVNIVATNQGVSSTGLIVKNDKTVTLIDNILVPNQNELDFTYNSIVSKGNPLTNTASINFQPNTQTISMSDTSLNNITINNQPTLNTHGANKLYVDTHVRTLSNITTYINTLAGTLPTIPTVMSDTAWNQINWTGATFVTPTPLNFSVVSPGVLQYNGTATRWFNIILEICCEVDSPDQSVQYVMLDNSNTPQPSTFGCFFTKDNTFKNGGTCSTFNRQLATGNQIKFGFRTPRAINNLSLIGYKIQILEV